MEKTITLEFTAEELNCLSAALAAWRNVTSEDKNRFLEMSTNAFLEGDNEGYDQYIDSYADASARFKRISKLHSKINRAKIRM